MTIYILGTLTVLLPLLHITWLAFGQVYSKTEWLLRLILVGSIVFIFYRIGTWSITSYYLKFGVVTLYFGSVIFSFLRIRPQSSHPSGNLWPRIVTTTLFTLIGITMSIHTFVGANYSGHTISLDFPLTNGKYFVIQGGSNTITNPFHSILSNGKYAIDLVKIGKFGNRAVSIFPSKLNQYHIFAETVYSPCNGYVVSTISGIEDNLPTKVDRKNTAGNHIIIECNDVSIILAHLKLNSIRVTKGSEVRKGQPIGEVGNTGYSDEPHLHIQANTHSGKPVAIKFADKFLSINDLYVTQE